MAKRKRATQHPNPNPNYSDNPNSSATSPARAIYGDYLGGAAESPFIQDLVRKMNEQKNEPPGMLQSGLNSAGSGVQSALGTVLPDPSDTLLRAGLGVADFVNSDPLGRLRNSVNRLGDQASALYGNARRSIPQIKKFLALPRQANPPTIPSRQPNYMNRYRDPNDLR